jgi:hypothetical protein
MEVDAGKGDIISDEDGGCDKGNPKTPVLPLHAFRTTTPSG